MDNEYLKEMYQDLVLDYSKTPLNYRVIEHCSCQKIGKNPMCGDLVQIFLKQHNDIIEDISFVGSGCAMSMASSSILTKVLMGKTIIEAKKILYSFIHSITLLDNSDDELDENEYNSQIDLNILNDYDELGIFKGVVNFPTRIKCVLLPWRTFEKIIQEGIKNDN
jgi:nitrogen fixation protein NifU and related proteins